MRIMQNFMMSFKQSLLVTVVLLLSLFSTGCNDTNFDIGSNYLPNGQGMSMGSIDLRGYKVGSLDLDERVMSTKLYRTERIATSRQYYGALGAQRDVTFGERRSGFFAQYTPQYCLDDEGFGYEPIVDSVMMILSVADYAGDTTQVQRYNVYEVIDDSFVRNSVDTIFNADYKYPAGALSSEPIFTFDFPDQSNGYYVNSVYVKATIESAGRDLLDRLMLKEGADGSQIDYTYYNENYEFEDFVTSFKGIYICPAENSYAAGVGDAGATYNFDLATSGFGFYGRSRYEDDPAIVADTLGMSFVFLDSSVEDIGGVSITTVERDYSSSVIDVDTATTDLVSNDTHTSTVRVEALGGVVTQLTLEPAMFEEFERVLTEANDGYKTVFFNVAKLMVYREEAVEYDEPIELTATAADLLDKMPSRLGLYRTYSSYLDEDDSDTSEMVLVTDYNYTYESTYGIVSDYDGGYNRSLGCYVMNIPLEMQTIWTEYCDARDEAGGASKIDWDAQDWNKLVIAPTVDNLMSPRYISLQGEADGANATPIRLNITYTLLK